MLSVFSKYKHSAAYDVFFILKPTHMLAFDSPPPPPPKSIERKQYNQVPEADHSFYWTHV